MLDTTLFTPYSNPMKTDEVESLARGHEACKKPSLDSDPKLTYRHTVRPVWHSDGSFESTK